MFRKSSNNPFIPVGGLNSGSFAQIGGPEVVGQRFKGLLGQTVVYDNAAALKASKTSVGTLYSGVYQLVKLNSAVLRGEVVYWDTLANNGLKPGKVWRTPSGQDFKLELVLIDDPVAMHPPAQIITGDADHFRTCAAKSRAGLPNRRRRPCQGCPHGGEYTGNNQEGEAEAHANQSFDLSQASHSRPEMHDPHARRKRNHIQGCEQRLPCLAYTHAPVY